MNIQENLDQFFTIINSFKKEQSESSLENYKGYQDLFDNPYFQSFLKRSPMVVAIYNFPLQKYDLITDNVGELCDLKPEDFLKENGVAGFFNAMDDLSKDQILSNITPAMLRCCSEYASEIKNLVFNACIVLKKGVMGNKWVLLQCYILESTPEGFPLLSCTIATDVSEMKKDSIIYYSANLKKEDNQIRLLYQKTYPEMEEELNLSLRELEVLREIYFGRTSKEIADKLNISFNTVKKHRFNILLKTRSSNTPELINKARFQGLI